MKRNNFTLIELLVVVALIAILLSILLPSLSKARRVAKITVCVSNTSEIGKAIYLHFNDNDNRFPDRVGGSHAGYNWVGHKGIRSDRRSNVTDRPLNKYLGYDDNSIEVEVAKCPLDYYKNRYAGVTSYWKGSGSSYMGTAFNGIRDLDINSKGIHHAQVIRPASMVAIGEIGAVHYAMPYTPFDLAGQWHSPGKARYAVNYVDGHSGNVTVERGSGITHSFDKIDFRNRN